MASSLTDRQLILLDNLIYLKWDNMEEPSLRDDKVGVYYGKQFDR